MTEVWPVSPTERKIAEMLLENTGAAMMDSGGIYGRAWQTERTRFGLDGGLPNSSFHGGPGHAVVDPSADDVERVALAMREAPYVTIDKYGTVELDTFHFLVEHLDYEPTLDAKYQRWQRVTNFGKDRWAADWGLALMERFVDQLQAKGYKVGGIYGEGGPITENSYNGDHAVGRVLQVTLFTVENPHDRSDFLPEDSYVLLQIHGGADVRGGYTDPVLFTMNDEYGILDWGRVYLVCEGNPALVAPGQLEFSGREANSARHQWESENGGYTFNLDGMWGQGETVMAFDDYSVENRGAIKAIYDEGREVWLCPIEGCGAVLR